MKAVTVLSLMILFLWGCSLTDGGSPTPSRNTGTMDTTDIDEIPAGKYDGNWRVVYAHESGYESYQIGNEEPYLDELDNLQEIPDTTVLSVIKGDSIYIYFYDPEVDGDTVSLESIRLSDLNEYDTTGMESGLKSQIYDWTGAESVNFSFNDIGYHAVLIGDGNSLIIEFHYIFDFSYTAQAASETTSGTYAVSATNAYGLVRYDGVVPPDHWPTTIVQDTGDSGSPEELYGAWQMLYSDAEMAITIDLEITEGELTVTETVTAYYYDIDGDFITDTITGETLDLLLSESGITNPEVEYGSWELKEGQISVLWYGDTTPELLYYELYGEDLYISGSEGTMHFVRTEAVM